MFANKTGIKDHHKDIVRALHLYHVVNFFLTPGLEVSPAGEVKHIQYRHRESQHDVVSECLVTTIL